MTATVTNEDYVEPGKRETKQHCTNNSNVSTRTCIEHHQCEITTQQNSYGSKNEGLTLKGCAKENGKQTMRRSSCTTNTDTNTAGTNRHRAEKSGRGQERIFEFLPLVSLLGNCFPTDVNCVYIFCTGVNPVSVFEVLLPPPASKSCWVHTSPFVTIHFPLLLFLTPPAEVTTVQYFRNRMCFFKACEVTSHSVFLDMESVHGGSVVLFHALVAHSVYSHPEGTNVFIWSSSETEHACMDPRAPGG